MFPPTPGLVDTHCHLDLPAFDADRAATLERAWQAGLTGILVPAVSPDRWEALLEWPKTDGRVQVALGIHPQALPQLPEADDDRHLARLDELLGRGIALAVGECGLDGPSAKAAPMARQLRVLRAHLELARKHRLPVVLHCLRAHPDLMRLFKDESLPPRGAVMHSYSGSNEITGFYVSKGCHFSFAGPVTFTEARRPLDALRAVPIDRLMAETDAPDQAPHPHRGQRCEPAYLPLMIAAMARARGETEAQLRRAIGANVERFFS